MHAHVCMSRCIHVSVHVSVCCKKCDFFCTLVCIVTMCAYFSIQTFSGEFWCGVPSKKWQLMFLCLQVPMSAPATANMYYFAWFFCGDGGGDSFLCPMYKFSFILCICFSLQVPNNYRSSSKGSKPKINSKPKQRLSAVLMVALSLKTDRRRKRRTHTHTHTYTHTLYTYTTVMKQNNR